MIFQSMPYRFTRNEWIKTLKNALNTESTGYTGHKYIYLNRNGECKAFFTSSEAHQQGFRRKMTIDNIIAISQKYFKDYKLGPLDEVLDEINDLGHAFEVMDKGAQQSWWSRLIHFLRGLGFKNTHELIEEQLLQILDQKIQHQYRTLTTNLDKIKQTLSLLNDERFKQAYEKLFQQAAFWATPPNQMLPKSYEGWKKRESELFDLFLKSQEMINFNQCISTILKQHRQLAQLLELHPQAPIEQPRLKQIALSLETLINQRFVGFEIHDEVKYQQTLAQLRRDLEQSISLVHEDYKRQRDYQANRVDEILSRRKIITSPLRGIIALRQKQLPESKGDVPPREWGAD